MYLSITVRQFSLLLCMHFFVVCIVFEVNKSEMVNHIYRATVSDYSISISIQTRAKKGERTRNATYFCASIQKPRVRKKNCTITTSCQMRKIKNALQKNTEHKVSNESNRSKCDQNFSPQICLLFLLYFLVVFVVVYFFYFACPVPLPPLHRLALFGLQFKFGAPNTTITCVMVVGSVSCCIDGSEI